MTLNTPPLLCYVDLSFISDNQKGFELAYMVAVQAVSGRPLLFTVHLQSGALYSRLPISAIVTNEKVKRTWLLPALQPWSCLEGPAQLVVYEHLKNYEVDCRLLGVGRYLFTIEYHGEGLANDPGQTKSHNVIALYSGQLCALPNNNILFADKFFTKINGWPKYKRQTRNYYVE